MTLHPILALDQVIEEYRDYLRTEFRAKDPALKEALERELDQPLFLAQEPFFQAHRPFRPGKRWDALPLDPRLARVMTERARRHGATRPEYAFLHQSDAIANLLSPDPWPLVVTTGTGSGKTEAFLLPVIQNALEDAARYSRSGLTAILVYPMNALANDQFIRIEEYLQGSGFRGQVSVAQYDRGTSQAEREALRRNPPHILLTDYLMLEYLLVRPADRDGIFANHRCRYLVLDEIHTYRGTLGANIALLVRHRPAQPGLSQGRLVHGLAQLLHGLLHSLVRARAARTDVKLARRRAAVAGDAGIQRLRLLHGQDAQLAGQDLPAALVLVHGQAALAQVAVEPHGLPVHVLAQGIAGQDLLRAGQAVLVLTPLAVCVHQPAQAAQIEQAQALPLAQRPVVVEALQQLTTAQLHALSKAFHIRRLQLISRAGQRLARSLLEDSHIQPVVAGAVEAELPQSRAEQIGAAGHPLRLQRAAQPPHGRVETASRFVIAAAAPEDARQRLPAVHALSMQQEVSQQSLDWMHRCRVDGKVLVIQAQCAEEPNA